MDSARQEGTITEKETGFVERSGTIFVYKLSVVGIVRYKVLTFMG